MDDHKSSKRSRSKSRSPSPPSKRYQSTSKSNRRNPSQNSDDSSPRQNQHRNQNDQNQSSSSSSEHRREHMDQKRKSRMEKLRAENEAEEKRMAKEAERAAISKQHASGKEGPIIKMDEQELEGLDEEEQMYKLLGFAGGFGSTKGQAVEDNKKTAARGAASKNKARKYRQYMNRKGGFNRPLDKMT